MMESRKIHAHAVLALDHPQRLPATHVLMVMRSKPATTQYDAQWWSQWGTVKFSISVVVSETLELLHAG